MDHNSGASPKTTSKSGLSSPSPPSSPWNQNNEFNSTPRSLTTSSKTLVTKQVVVNGKTYGVNLVDRRTGQTYYYDFETCESKWGELPIPSTPSGYSAVSAAKQQSGTSTQDVKQEWVRLVDHQGREFEYNRRTCASRWAS